MAGKIHPGHLAQILERQANLWEIRQRLHQEGGEAARRELAHLSEGPWLSVSKQLASGGIDLAQRVADRLGWQVYDREILQEIARHTQARETVLSRLDEREVGWLEDTLSRLLTPEAPGHAAYLQEMVRVIWALGRKGRAVIVGRGGNWLLNPLFGLRVRVIAPVDTRAERLARQEKLAPAEAHARVKEADREHARFARQAFGRDIEDPLGYDLLLNLGSLEVEAAAEAVVAALHRKLREPPPSTA